MNKNKLNFTLSWSFEYNLNMSYACQFSETHSFDSSWLFCHQHQNILWVVTGILS